MSPVGLIGLGLLGSAMAERLIERGYTVVGFDVREEQHTALAERGGTAAATARDVLGQCEVVLLSLPNSEIVESVLSELGDKLAGKLVIDTTTGAPDRTIATAKSVAERGGRYLDATVVGSSALARRGEVDLLVGGDETSVKEAQPLFAALSRRAFPVGPSGSGARMKLVVNLVLGLNRAVLAEGLTLAKHAGLDPAVALDVLQSGAAYSRVMDAKGRRMVDGDFTPDARLSQHLKDVRLILQMAADSESPTPLSQLHRELLESAEQRGYGESDNSAIIRAFE